MFLKSPLFNGATNNPGLNLDDAPETFQKLEAPKPRNVHEFKLTISPDVSSGLLPHQPRPG